MPIIKNFDSLAITPERKIVLKLVEAGLASIQPDQVVSKNISLNEQILKINNQSYDLSSFENIYLLGFGKGSAGISGLIELILGSKITEGYVIDTTSPSFQKIVFTQGTHPVPSQVNFDFTKQILDRFSGKLTEKDLVLIVVCGGGSAMLVHPNQNITLQKKIRVNKALLESGATISEMNAVRKHLSDVKGGNLAKHLYPATVLSLMFSDVPGNDLSVIASGPTVLDPTTIEDAWVLIEKYNLKEKVAIKKSDLIETPKQEKYFKNVYNHIILSNQTALNAMKEKAAELAWTAEIYSDKFQSDAKVAAEKLIQEAKPHSILLAGGETTVTVTKDHGAGGRNQELVLASLDLLDENITICSYDSDGFDNSYYAGALADAITVSHTKQLHVKPKIYLNKDNALEFFDKVGDGINTGRLPSNVSDLMIVLKK